FPKFYSPSNDYHPANTVSNIRNEIPIILDYEKGNYSNWVEIFKIHCHACNVLDHIDPKTPHPMDLTLALSNCVDSIKATAQQTWDCLKNIFQDNSEIREIYNESNSLFLENFPDVSSFCKKAKEFKDQLENVGQTVSERTLVLRLCAGLIDTDLDGVAQAITQLKPLPSFDEA
ncbi:hypothetical protein RDABS01_022766, partial [Bienertia sinuspersici]